MFWAFMHCKCWFRLERDGAASHDQKWANDIVKTRQFKSLKSRNHYGHNNQQYWVPKICYDMLFNYLENERLIHTFTKISPG